MQDMNTNPAGNYMFKVNNKSTRARCEICSKLTIKTPEQCLGVVLVSLLLTLNIGIEVIRKIIFKLS